MPGMLRKSTAFVPRYQNGCALQERDREFESISLPRRVCELSVPERRGALIVNRSACTEVNLRRGFVRLGIGLTLLWFVFWTCAYVMRPQASENAPRLPALSPTTDIALIAVVIVGLPWIVSGFRSN